VRLLTELHAPPRLTAHLRMVHDVATDLAAWAGERLAFQSAYPVESTA
jgi:hypothetical protein